MNRFIKTATATLALAFVFNACQKMDRPELGDYTRDANPPGGPLKFFVAFDGTTTDPLMNAVDSIRATFPSSNPLAPAAGINGMGVQGERGKAIKYPSANDWAATATSMTIAFWMKHIPHSDGPEFYFSLPTTEHWHNSQAFMMIEDKGQSTAELATVKVALFDQWFEFTGEKRMTGGLLNGNWHHFALVYDETTSKLTYYLDGVPFTNLDPSLTDVKKNGQPRGPLEFSNTSGFIVGGWNKHAGSSGPTDAWINSFSGQMDQFRLYGQALTAAEIQALFNSKM
ncbi:MAG: LamG-like jellyroll fold domain-containing protein [Flavitalea sp.]